MRLIRHVKQMVDSGSVGEIRAFAGSFSTATRPGIWTSIFKAESGGGALMHQGVYPLSLACLVMGPVIKAHTVAAFGETGVDEDTTVTCRHENGISTLQTSLRTNAANDFQIMGTTGVIHVENPIHCPFRLHYRPGDPRKEAIRESGLVQGLIRRVRAPIALMRGRSGKTITKNFTGNGYRYEADELIRSVRAGRIESKILSLDDRLIVMEALDKAYASWP